MLQIFIERLRKEGMIDLSVRVRPSASQSVVKSIMSDGSLKIDVAAVPEEGEANHELRRMLAEAFGVSIDCIEILSGDSGRLKRVRVSAK